MFFSFSRLPFSRFSPHFRRASWQRLGWLCAAPLLTLPVLTLPARAQNAASQPTGGAEQNPTLSSAARPASAIANSFRSAPQKRRAPLSPNLIMALPDESVKTSVAPAKISVSTTPKIATLPVVIARVPGRETLSSVTNLAPAPTALPVVRKTASPVAAKADGAKIVVASTRDASTRGASKREPAQLPARGGLIFKSAPVELRPEQSESEAPAISDSQRLLLARLDADLARAQKRLSRAESRLSEGQKQLGTATGLLQNAMLEAGEDARGLHPFVRVAQRYLGTPYVWGGESARGFDCSGFIMRVMRDLGYRALPHSAAEQFRYGIPVAKSLLKPGDIVFFANTYKPGVSHVGIYLGRGRFIHAANSQVGTIVSGLNEPKWVAHYAGARRLISNKS